MKTLIMALIIIGCSPKMITRNNTSGCDSATKRFTVEYWKVQCERVKNHNKVLPEESEYLPVLSPDSCSVFFPL